MSLTEGYLAIFGGYPDGSVRSEFYPTAEIMNREMPKYKTIRTVACVIRIEHNQIIQVDKDFSLQKEQE